MNKKTKVILIEDHRLVGECFSEALKSNPAIEVIGLAGNGAEGIAMVRKKSPDLVLLDLGLPDIEGDKVAEIILQERKDI